MSNSKLIEKLNGGLGWELRAAALYAHYSAYVKGIHRLHLKPFFDEEATESHTHAEMVRAARVAQAVVEVTVDRALRQATGPVKLPISEETAF